MPPWSVAAVVAAVCMASHYLMLRVAAGRLGDGLGALCVEGTAAVGILVYLVFRSDAEPPPALPGILWSCGAGLAISFVTTLTFVALRLGGPVSATGTMVFGGGVALAALVAPLIFGEAFTVRRTIGVTLGLASLVLLATDRS